MNRAEQFDYLIHVVERWTEEKKPADGGPFRCLEEDSLVREICVTPGVSVSAAQLKTYLATAVLEIYPWNTDSKVSYRDIRRFLAGESTAKKYAFYFGRLELLFSPRENRQAAERSRLIRMEEPPEGEAEIFPIALLERLQELARVRLGEYWLMCAPDYDGSPGGRIRWKQRIFQGLDAEDELPANRQNKYMECIMTVALHEIFLRECGRLLGMAYAKACEGRDSVRQAGEGIAAVAERLKEADESGAEEKQDAEAITYLEKTTREVRKYTQDFREYLFFRSVYLEYLVGLEAELVLIMALEARNLEVMKPWTGKRQTEWLMACVGHRETESFTRYNKNRERYYRQMREDMEEYVYRFLDGIGRRGRQRFEEAMTAWLNLAAEKNPEEEERKKLWEAQCILILPLWTQESDRK